MKTYLILLSCVLYIGQLNAQGKTLRPLFEKHGITVKDQGKRPTCSIFAMVGLIEFERANVLGEKTPLSVDYLNWAANKTEGADWDGSFFHFAIDGMARYGICADDYMPYAVRFSAKFEPSDAAKEEAKSRTAGKQVWIKPYDPKTGISAEHLKEIQKQIDNDHPVAIGFYWPREKVEKEKKFLDKGELAVLEREDMFDGHSILIVGYQANADTPGGGYLIFKNSHGESFGEGGYGRIPYEYAFRYANDAMAFHLK